MRHAVIGPRPLTACILAVVALAGFATVSCTDPSGEGGGLLQSPTHEADALRQEEERRQQDRSRNGGGGY